MSLLRAWIVLCLAFLAACSEQPEERPAPADLTRDAVGHFCGMIVLDHPGPKGQAFVTGRDAPLWFTSVRDAIAFSRLPEESGELRVIYINDMARAGSWEAPEPEWIPAQEAVYVIGSSRRGGMGALEAVPFSSQAAAEDFVERYGGCTVSLEEIPRDYVLGDAVDPGLDWCARVGNVEK